MGMVVAPADRLRRPWGDAGLRVVAAAVLGLGRRRCAGRRAGLVNRPANRALGRACGDSDALPGVGSGNCGLVLCPRHQSCRGESTMSDDVQTPAGLRTHLAARGLPAQLLDRRPTGQPLSVFLRGATMDHRLFNANQDNPTFTNQAMLSFLTHNVTLDDGGRVTSLWSCRPAPARPCPARRSYKGVQACTTENQTCPN